MVNPKNMETIKFIQPLLQSFGYSFHSQAIDSEDHQLIIATYLQRLPNQSTSAPTSNDNSSPTLYEDFSDDEEVEDQDFSEHRSHNLHDRPTLIVNKMVSAANETKSPQDVMSFEYDNSKIFSSEPQIDKTIINQVLDNKNASADGKIDAVENSITKLTDLPPKQLWQELLSRAISGGIGRLFFRQLARQCY